MMQFESGPDTMNDTEDRFSNQKRAGELLEDGNSKNSKLEASCDATIATDASTSPKNSVSIETQSVRDNYKVWLSLLFL